MLCAQLVSQLFRTFSMFNCPNIGIYLEFNSCYQWHRSDSNQDSDYIASFVSLISGSGGQNFKI